MNRFDTFHDNGWQNERFQRRNRPISKERWDSHRKESASDKLEYMSWVKDIVGKLNFFVNKERIEALSKCYLLDEDGAEIREDIEALLSPYLPSLVFSKKPLLASPKQEDSDAEIRFGLAIQGERQLHSFGLSRSELNQHVLATARSGAGKTTLIIQIIRQLISNNIPFLVIDYKRDYRHLVRHYPQLVVVKWRDLKINPLDPPPGVSFQEWKQQFVNIFGHVEAIWHGSTQYLLEAIDTVYERQERIPKIQDIYETIVEKAESSRKMQEYASVVEVRLFGLLSKLGNVINSHRTLTDMEKLLQLPVVLELDGLGRDEASILALWLFYWIYAYRRAQMMRGSLLHVLIIDEAKRIFTGSEQYSETTTEYSGIPPADLVCDEIRDFGEAIIASDQEPTKLSNSLKANTYTKMTGFLGNGRDIDDIAHAMDLKEEEREAITQLERGEWLVKLAGRYTKPFIIKSEDFPLEKNVSEEELERVMRPTIENLTRVLEEKPIRLEINEEEPEISQNSYNLLLNINLHPFNGIVARQKELGTSAARIEAAKEELISKELVRQVDIPLSGRRPTAFLVLTGRALKFLDSKGVDISTWRHVGNVGFEHMLYQVLIRWEFKKLAYDAHLEVRLSDKRRIDVLAIKDGRRIGVEVELNTNVDLSQKLVGIESLDQLYVVARREILGQVKTKLGSLPDKVAIYAIDQFIGKIRNLCSE